MTEEHLVIQIRNLSMRYSEQQVLSNISLDVPKGQIIGYIGPNGAGKSTTIKTMLGLVHGYTGHITIFGRNIADGDVAYKRRIGYVPETAELYEMLSAEEYLGFIGSLYGMDATQTAEKAASMSRLFGLADAYHARMASYSKGMRQKVLLIAALLHNPEILFLDEPLSGLDANSVIMIKDLLATLAGAGKTIFYSSHIMDVVERVSHRIVLINRGQIQADGTFEDLQNRVHAQSLEDVFGQMTGFVDHSAIAQECLAIIEGAPS